MSSKNKPHKGINFKGMIVDPFESEMVFSPPTIATVELGLTTIKALSNMFASLGQDILDASRNITEAVNDLRYTISTTWEK